MVILLLCTVLCSDEYSIAEKGCAKSANNSPEKQYIGYKKRKPLTNSYACLTNYLGGDFIYMKKDNFNPDRHRMELSKTKFAFGYEYDISDKNNPPQKPKATNVVVEDLVIERYANPLQTGAIGYYRPGAGWKVRNCIVRWNHGAGIRFASECTSEELKAKIIGNSCHDNGQYGITSGDGDPIGGGIGDEDGWGWGGAGCGALVAENFIVNNGREDVGVKVGWAAGGTKFSQCKNFNIWDNYISSNRHSYPPQRTCRSAEEAWANGSRYNTSASFR